MKSRIIIMAIIAMMMISCTPGESDAEKSGKISILVTTGMIGDLVSNIGGDRVDVVTLMGPGVDPHLYKASAGDISKLSKAEMIFYNGLFLEGKMAEILKKIARTGKPTIAIGEIIDKSVLRKSEKYQGHPDPHIWFDVSMWVKTIDVVLEALVEKDPPSGAYYRENAAAYRETLEALHNYCLERTREIPEGQRIMITAHDAFGYFGAAYGVEVYGLQGINTSSEYGIKDVHRLVEMVVEKKIRAVFVETSVPRKSIEAVVEGARAHGQQVIIGGELFSDAMGEAGTPEGTYLGMVKHNVDTIVEALK